MDLDLTAHWQQHTRSLAADPAAIADVFTELRRAYTESHRHYHTLRHIAAMFALLDARQSGDPVTFWATWFHDVVYNPMASDNEQRSADMARVHLRTLNIDDATIAAVERWILATRSHNVDPQCPADEQTFLDADMSILGVDAATYVSYTERVRQEFSQVPAFLYRRGRRQFVEKTLAMPRIYGTSWFSERFEAAARTNLRAELDRL